MARKKTNPDVTPEKKEEVKLPLLEYKVLNSNSKNTAIHTLMVQVKNKKLNLFHAVQRRSEQWDLQKKSKFLNSLITGIISPEIVICEMNGEKFVCDGKQRLSCLDEFINKKDTKLTVFGRKFDELDENTKEALTGSNINVVTYSDCTDEDVFSIFERMNNGVSLSGPQKSKSYASIAILEKINKILDTPFFTEKSNITKGQKLKDEDFNVVIQSCILVSGWDFKNFSSKEVDRFLQENDEQTIMNTLEVIKNNVDLLDSIITEKHKNLKKIHLPMIISTVNDSPEYKDKLLNFLNDYDNQTEYRQYCQGSTSQKENVIGRLIFWKSN